VSELEYTSSIDLFCNVLVASNEDIKEKVPKAATKLVLPQTGQCEEKKEQPYFVVVL
jgi:hypothetical protein